MRVEISQVKCLRCNHTWTPRKRDVRICPKCRSPYWDVPRSRKIKKKGGGKSD